MDARSFGPHEGGPTGEYARLSALVVSDPDATWLRLLEIAGQVDDADLFWVADILEDFLIYHPARWATHIEPELARNEQLRRALIDVVPTTADEALADRVLELRGQAQREFPERLGFPGTEPKDHGRVPKPRGELERTYLAWRNEPFPHGSSTDSVDELHAELVYVDVLVADYAIPVAGEGARRPGSVDVVEALNALDAKVKAIYPTVAPGDRDLLDAYRRYVRLMRDVYAAARNNSR